MVSVYGETERERNYMGDIYVSTQRETGMRVSAYGETEREREGEVLKRGDVLWSDLLCALYMLPPGLFPLGCALRYPRKHT